MDLDGIPVFLINSNRLRDIMQYSEEFQGQGKAFGDRLTYVLGVYYFMEKGTDGSTSSQFPERALAGQGLPLTTPAATFLNALHVKAPGACGRESPATLCSSLVFWKNAEASGSFRIRDW